MNSAIVCLLWEIYLVVFYKFKKYTVDQFTCEGTC